MKEALKEAGLAYRKGEIPVGAVVVINDEVVSTAHNNNRYTDDPTNHAEMIAIKKACAAVSNERLTGATLYVTKEPCVMCAGAIIHSRIENVIIGCRDIKYGSVTVFNVLGNDKFNHVPRVEFGIFEEECGFLMSEFFKNLRDRKVSND